MADRITLGSTLSGLLIDGLDHTPWIAATMTVTDRGVQVTVPHLHGDDQFQEVTRWLDRDDGDTNLLLESIDLRISLFGLRLSSRRTDMARNIAEGQLLADNAVMRPRDGDLADPLLVEEVRSEIDGLTDWSRLHSLRSEVVSLGEGPDIRDVSAYVLEQVDGLEWTQGEAQLRITTTWEVQHGSLTQIEDRATLISSFPAPRSIADHIQEQRKFANLLAVVFGTRISFRRHEVRDSRFPARSLSGRVSHLPYVDLISSTTFRESQTERPSRKVLIRPLFYMGHLQPTQLQDWAANYDGIGRALHPYLEVLRTPSAALENRAINAAMSLEALGNRLERVEGEECTYRNSRRRTMATWVLRCILNANHAFTPEAFNSSVLFARAIAKNYNTIKHPGNEFPDSLHTYILCELSVSIVRHNIVKMALGEAVFTNVDGDEPYRQANMMLQNYGLVIEDDGKISVRSQSDE
ncbi:ApeA N-terminal domain 1-containing protein [Sinomonas albida]|uniref:ApeA N-terminal domain 1-containing protein n=1 Tax=Sinomonas albida TaxID=369942 RepID=UPI0010A8D6AC|nr:hypothetical protein [Sinomonas albida]